MAKALLQSSCNLSDVRARQARLLQAKEDYTSRLYSPTCGRNRARHRRCKARKNNGRTRGAPRHALASSPSHRSKAGAERIGAIIPKPALERISAYIGKDPRFRSLEELEAMVRLVLAPFGALTDAQWRHIAETGSKQHADGSWGMCYDPGIAIPFQKSPPADVDLWQFYDAIRCPTLLLRGASVRPVAEVRLPWR